MPLASRDQIIQNQHKTVRRAVPVNVCWRKSSCELFTLATTHAKVANSSSCKVVIACYRICFVFFKSGATAIAPGKLARYFSSSLLTTSGNNLSISGNGKIALTVILPYEAK